MKSILDDLKEIMDSTKLNDLDFSENNKANVLKSLKHPPKKKPIRLKPIVMNLASITLTCLFLLVSGYLVADKLELFSSSERLATEPIIEHDNFVAKEANEIDLNNPDILKASEYRNVEDFILSAKHQLNSNPPSFEDPSIESWQLDVARWVTAYSKHFAALSTDNEEITLLHNIEEASLKLFKPGDSLLPKSNQEELVANLNSALDEFIEQRIEKNN